MCVCGCCFSVGNGLREAGGPHLCQRECGGDKPTWTLDSRAFSLCWRPRRLLGARRDRRRGDLGPWTSLLPGPIESIAASGHLRLCRHSICGSPGHRRKRSVGADGGGLCTTSVPALRNRCFGSTTSSSTLEARASESSTCTTLCRRWRSGPSIRPDGRVQRYPGLRVPTSISGISTKMKSTCWT